MADLPDVAADAGDETILTAGARATGIVTTNYGREGKLMSGVGLIVMKPPDHDVCVQTGEADEKGSRALVLKARSVDSHFVESQVVRLTGHIPGGERAINHGGVRGQESHVIDCLEVALSFDAVADLNWREAP